MRGTKSSFSIHISFFPPSDLFLNLCFPTLKTFLSQGVICIPDHAASQAKQSIPSPSFRVYSRTACKM